MKKIILSALLAAVTSTSFALSLPALPDGTADLSKLGIDPNTVLNKIPADVRAKALQTVQGLDAAKVNALRSKLPADVQAKLVNFKVTDVDLAALRAKLRK